MDKDTSKKVNSIWNLIKTIIGLIIAAVCGAGVENATSVFHNLIG